MKVSMTVRVNEINNLALDSTLVLYNRAYYQVQCYLNYKLPVGLKPSKLLLESPSNGLGIILLSAP